eukprot:5649496-Prymnesium_polylepis.2
MVPRFIGLRWVGITKPLWHSPQAVSRIGHFTIQLYLHGRARGFRITDGPCTVYREGARPE